MQRSKDEAHMSIEARGGRVVASPSRKADDLVAGAGAGTKLARARELGVTILSEEELERMTRDAGPITEAQRKAYLG